MQDLTPQQIVRELDRYIVGQQDAKRAMAVALRTRYRRQLLPDDLRDEVMPKNLLLIGPTGVGKTEIARRISRLTDAPFIKVEATKFTEMGYVGHDVESIVRDLLDTSVNMIHTEQAVRVRERAEAAAREKLITYIIQQSPKGRELVANLEAVAQAETEVVPVQQRTKLERRLKRQRKLVGEMLTESRLDNETVEIEIENDIDGYTTMLDLVGEFGDELGNMVAEHAQSRKRSRRVSVADAMRILVQEESQKLIDFDAVIDDAVRRTEQHGIVFIDEMDKLISNGYESSGDVSGEGVQRDLLPIVEGSTVMTRYGPVRTDHVLFIAAGSFHENKPSDLIPELQGRFPLRVELQGLSEDDLRAILTQPDNALTRQYQALLSTENVELEFTEDGISEIAAAAWEMNDRLEDIGARRLQTVLEQVLEDISFRATELEEKHIRVDAAFVRERISDLVEDEDLSRFIL